MKLYFVMGWLGLVTATAGPLPYDQAECEQRKAEREAEFDEKWRDYRVPLVLNSHVAGRVVTRKDVTFACVFATSRPEITWPF